MPQVDMPSFGRTPVHAVMELNSSMQGGCIGFNNLLHVIQSVSLA